MFINTIPYNIINRNRNRNRNRNSNSLLNIYLKLIITLKMTNIFNKKQLSLNGTLITNWLEERGLRDITGEGR